MSAAFIQARLARFEKLWERKAGQTPASQPIQIRLMNDPQHMEKDLRSAHSFVTTPAQIAEDFSMDLRRTWWVASVNYWDAPLEEVVDADDEVPEDLPAISFDTSCCQHLQADAKAPGILWDMQRPLEGSCDIRFLDQSSPEAFHVFWHSSAHLLGSAIEQLFGGQLTIGPALEKGFYYDAFLEDRKYTQDDRPLLEKKMMEISKQNLSFQRLVISKSEALDMFQENPFKVELIESKIPDGQNTTVYRLGDFIDLCRGPHLEKSSMVKAVLLHKHSATNWKGDTKLPSLQRMYGMTFRSDKEMKLEKKKIELADSRDHRRLGISQELFFFHPIMSPGSCFWLPHGAKLYNRIQEFIRTEYLLRGFHEVITPNIYAKPLFETSGHYQNYKENMYEIKVDGVEWFLKPMNCPGHCLVFDQYPKTYRDLPLRLASFGVLHRNESSGSLSGLTRVRRFQQDDAHIFCTPGQIGSEVQQALNFLFFVYDRLGFQDFSLTLSTKPHKAMGDPDMWTSAEIQLRDALELCGRPWKVNQGDGAFYGPKIDICLKDALDRQHQCGTIQLDFQLPIRFNLQYHIGDENVSHEGFRPGHERPVMIHRAILGSVERMIAILCENTNGKWPFWLSPRQVKVIPVSKASFEYAAYVNDQFHKKGFNFEVDLSTNTLNRKVLDAQAQQFNYTVVLGAKEEADRTVNLRVRGAAKGAPGQIMSLDAFLTFLNQESAVASQNLDDFDKYESLVPE